MANEPDSKPQPDDGANGRPLPPMTCWPALILADNQIADAYLRRARPSGALFASLCHYRISELLRRRFGPEFFDDAPPDQSSGIDETQGTDTDFEFADDGPPDQSDDARDSRPVLDDAADPAPARRHLDYDAELALHADVEAFLAEFAQGVAGFEVGHPLRKICERLHAARNKLNTDVALAIARGQFKASLGLPPSL